MKMATFEHGEKTGHNLIKPYLDVYARGVEACDSPDFTQLTRKEQVYVLYAVLIKAFWEDISGSFGHGEKLSRDQARPFVEKLAREWMRSKQGSDLEPLLLKAYEFFKAGYATRSPRSVDSGEDNYLLLSEEIGIGVDTLLTIYDFHRQKIDAGLLRRSLAIQAMHFDDISIFIDLASMNYHPERVGCPLNLTGLTRAFYDMISQCIDENSVPASRRPD